MSVQQNRCTQGKECELLSSFTLGKDLHIPHTIVSQNCFDGCESSFNTQPVDRLQSAAESYAVSVSHLFSPYLSCWLRRQPNFGIVKLLASKFIPQSNLFVSKRLQLSQGRLNKEVQTIAFRDCEARFLVSFSDGLFCSRISLSPFSSLFFVGPFW